MATKPATTQERIGRVGQRRQVVIPREMLETLNIQEGDFVAFAQQHNGVLIKAKRLVDPDDTLTPAEAERAARGDAQWSNVKALQGPQWNGRLRKRVGPYRIIFRKHPDRGVVEISAILVKSKGAYR